MSELIPNRGNYKKLISYQKSDVIFQITSDFCEHFIAHGDWTIDQMIQAARSGKQNIVEGSADYLLFRQLERLAMDFAENGGFSEKMSQICRNNRGY